MKNWEGKEEREVGGGRWEVGGGRWMDKKRWESVGLLTVTDEVEVDVEVRM